MSERQDLAGRVDAHLRLASTIAELADDQLLALLADVPTRAGWGTTCTIGLGDRRVFVKSLPVTDVELADLTSTRNHHSLPVWYHYGVGSAGFGAARELAAHVKVSEWVLAGRIAHFPLLHHHRLLPLAGQTRHLTAEELDRYTSSWDGSESVRSFISAREASRWALTMFIEHVPHVLQDWLPVNQHGVGWVVDQGLAVTDFLRAEGVAHLDLNSSNVLTDGTQLYVGDFGLFLDGAFDLDPDERAFLAGHLHYDIAELLTTLDWPRPGQEVQYGDEVTRQLARYEPIRQLMRTLLRDLHRGPKHRAVYEDARVADLLAVARRP